MDETISRPARRKIPWMTVSADDDVSTEDWFLQAWMNHFGKRQADLAKAMGWSKNRAHFVWHSSQPYRRPEVNRIAKWLGIRPFELLMSPREAMALRGLRQTAAIIVAENDAAEFDHTTVPARKSAGAGKQSR